MRTAVRLLRLVQVFVGGFTLVILAAGSLPPFSYNRDLHQDYLGARALRDGLDPYTPLPDLSERYFPVRTTALSHPTPHPPVVLLLSVPMSFAPYEMVYPLGLAANVLLLLLIGRWLGLSVHGSLALALWPPIWWVLFLDQFEILLLTLAMLAWRAAEGGKLWRAGLWLGLAATVKLYPVVFLLPFAARRQIPVLLGAGGVLVLAEVVNALVVGPTGLIRYYTEVIPPVTNRYLSLSVNASPYGALLRLFGGSVDVEPIVELPALVLPLAAGVALLGLYALVRLGPRAAPLATLVTLPAAWSYQVVLALPEIVRLLRLPRWRPAILAASMAASFTFYPLLFYANELIVEVTGWSGDRVPPVSGLLAAVQTAGFVALLVFSLSSPEQRRT